MIPNTLLTNQAPFIDTLYVPGSTIDGMAIDHSTGQLFYSDIGQKAIVSMMTDGSGETVVVSGVDSPRAVAIDARNK